MKNFFKFFGIIISILFFTNKTFSYGIDFENNGFYSNFSKNISGLESKMYSIENKNNFKNTEKVNTDIGKKCINKELTESEIKEISRKQDISSLMKNISDDCKNNDGSIPISTTQKIISSIKNLDMENQKNSSDKSKKIISMSNIGIYSDGDDKNSPFDLKVDFNDIEKILFQEPTISDYTPEKTIDLGEKIKKILNKLNSTDNNKNENISNHSTLCDLNGSCDSYTEIQKIICENNGNCTGNEKEGFLSIKNNFDCKVDSSGLNSISGKLINTSLNNLGNKNLEKQKNNKDSKNSKNKDLVPEISGNYKKVNDNKKFPCNDFFCIKINFKTYNHSFLGTGGTGKMSIEDLVNRSNNHLKKFVNSSLSQSKMTINNFQLSLKDINLPEMFHMGVQINYEPVPILFLEKDLNNSEDKENSKDSGELKLESQIEKYYKSYGLNYNLKNDLSAFEDTERKRQAGISSQGTQISSLGNKLEQLREVNNEKIEEINILKNTIEQKVKNENDSDIELRMKEIESYNKAINNYIINLDAILKEMLKIPVDSSKT